MSFSDIFFCFSASFRLRLSSSRRFLFSSSLCRFFSSSLLLLSSLFSSLILYGGRCITWGRFTTFLWTELLLLSFILVSLFSCFWCTPIAALSFWLQVNKADISDLETFNDWENKSTVPPTLYLKALWSWPLSLQAEFLGLPQTSPHRRSNSPRTVYILSLGEFQHQDEHIIRLFTL